MSPISYIRPKSDSTHQRPNHSYRQTFKVIDLNGSEQQKQLAIEAIIALTYQDAIQILHEQPSQYELHFWVNTTKYTQILKDSWSIIIGDNVARLGPAHYSKRQF